MGLELSEEKTKVTHITEGFTFLGYRIIRAIGETGKMVPKVLIPASAIKTLRHKVRAMLAPSTSSESVNAKIRALNSLTRGWCQYYRCTSSPSKVFGKLRQELFWGTAHWLGRKHKANMSVVLQRFSTGATLGTRTVQLLMPTEIKARKRLTKTWYNPYTEPDEVVKEKERLKRESLFSYDRCWTGHEDRPGGMDVREEVLHRDGPTGAMCGKTFHPSEVQVDHVIPRTRFKDPRDADGLGNQQVLCTDHHRAKTKTDLKVLSRMR